MVLSADPDGLHVGHEVEAEQEGGVNEVVVVVPFKIFWFFFFISSLSAGQ